MDTSETYIRMRVAAIPDLGMGDESFTLKVSYFVTANVWVAPNGNFYCRDNLSTKDVCCQLERQDQLQELVNDFTEYPKGIINKLYTFADFVHRKPYKSFKEKDEACHFFTSMEQLWLAFVMKELYQKVWDGEKWHKT